MMNEFRRASNEFKAQIEQEIAHLEVENKKQTILPPSPPPEGTTSRTLNAAPSEPKPVEAPATAPSSDDEPLFAAGTIQAPPESSTTTTQASDSREVAASTAQESHV
jgi:Sec-independent protein translocase protein TatA